MLSPADDLAEHLRALAPGRIVVNVAAPGALGALTRLRLAGSEARFWGCIADPRADRALPLGMIEPATAPLDPDAIVAALGRHGGDRDSAAQDLGISRSYFDARSAALGIGASA